MTCRELCASRGVWLQSFARDVLSDSRQVWIVLLVAPPQQCGPVCEVRVTADGHRRPAPPSLSVLRGVRGVCARCQTAENTFAATAAKASDLFRFGVADVHEVITM
jgi:hypothetical protein